MNLELKDDQECFVCGMRNQDGLQISWEIAGHITTAQFTPPKKYQGWKGLVHGGILATVLDEAMTRLASLVHGPAVTAEITIRYKAPAAIDELLYVRGEIVQDSKKIIEAKATIHNQTGTLIAQASSKVILIYPT